MPFLSAPADSSARMLPAVRSVPDSNMNLGSSQPPLASERSHLFVGDLRCKNPAVEKNGIPAASPDVWRSQGQSSVQSAAGAQQGPPRHTHTQQDGQLWGVGDLPIIHPHRNSRGRLKHHSVVLSFYMSADTEHKAIPEEPDRFLGMFIRPGKPPCKR